MRREQVEEREDGHGFVISAWVLTLAPGAAARLDVIGRLRAMRGVQAGELAPTGRLPLAVETRDIAGARALLAELESWPGVVHLDVVGFYDGPDELAA